MTALPELGAEISRDMVFTAEAIRAGAEFVGDHNPLHHDEARARASRYGGLIASGPHTAAILCGLATQGFGTPDPAGPGAVGVEFNVGFVGPVRADRPVRLWWRVVGIEPRRSGTIVRMQGGITEQATGAALLSATLAVFYFGAPAPLPDELSNQNSR